MILQSSLLKIFPEPILITTQRQTGGRGRIEKNGFPKRKSFYNFILKLDKIKINYRQFAILNAFYSKN